MTDRPVACRLIRDFDRAGAWNMAADQSILEHTTDRATLRLYTWQPATLSLGYFQPYDDRDAHRASRNAPCVRRASGGGAILHDREITYSLCMPLGHRWARSHTELYDRVHRSIIRTLAEWDVHAALHGDVAKPDSGDSESNRTNAQRAPFLCFLRRTSGDVVVGPHKIVGSAQRRGKHSLLQHGSILFERSELAPELAGIHDIAGQRIAPQDFLSRWTNELAGELGLEFSEQGLNDRELESAQRIERERFGNDQWTRKR